MSFLCDCYYAFFFFFFIFFFFFQAEDGIRDSSTSRGSEMCIRDRDYLYEYCNFGCAYFVLKNERVIKPKRTSTHNRKETNKRDNNKQSRNRSNRSSSRSKQRRKSNHKFTTKQKAAPFTEKQKKPANVAAKTGQQARTKKQSNGKRHFTIRQK
ncbi:hypothetical protein MUDAN_IGPPGNFN_03554 [Lactiplantibacillus mudanjiangensis]|nr:hypothetical protein MUDAN_IGPPGNFN_03554 [Lactiplantibacillus mudanjiangensis]